MPSYRHAGTLPAKRHTQMRAPDGRLYQEEEIGKAGFSSDFSLLYHLNAPTDVKAVESWDEEGQGVRPNHPLLPRQMNTHKLDQGGDTTTSRKLLAANADLRMSYVAADRPSPLYRNVGGDELYCLESGTARMESVFGALDLGPGDLLVMPRGVIHRITPTGPEPARIFVAESRGSIDPPRRYRSDVGQFLERSPYNERDLRVPTAPLVSVEAGSVEVYVRHPDGNSRYTYANHPFDVVGWDGYLYPYAFNIDEFQPYTNRLHHPPPNHQVFEAPGFVVCAYVPHVAEYHPDAVPVPYAHTNVDCDELMFWVAEATGPRAGHGIGEGAITLHPGGFTHGPRPGEIEKAVAAQKPGVLRMRDIRAIMIDTFAPLQIGESALQCERNDYLSSWHGA
ncbi:homogentisate 1,2-dioxygenase [Rhodococcus sp. LB1]|uniref:homogentisate 1,2-dioxygenase n=1 Tax=Rhodococcus sp. LB1 TaxID=1807499 RepID=UPI00077AE8AD|nr:homogentisate 1,2-dioxygenase [Rhodococcus sp. LB1]KXX55887.1 homogentisate 1,2-dioxygenase [Rhodococcus sp. LB1]